MKEDFKKEQQTEGILSPKILDRLKETGTQGGALNPVAIVKLIESTGSIEMYLTEYNPENYTAYGFVVMSFMDFIDAEFKTIDMSILEEMKENDETAMFVDPEFEECHLRDCIDAHLYIEKIKQKDNKKPTDI